MQLQVPSTGRILINDFVSGRLASEFHLSFQSVQGYTDLYKDLHSGALGSGKILLQKLLFSEA